ncbi:MAG TPA: hypothetical protein VHP14_07600, partial [Anaerolineales bacterium]|nr:hypothetical protein [Anaerolineales bacterium]
MGGLVITSEAKEAVDQMIGNKSRVVTVRLDLKPGACSWPSFGLTVHRKLDNDFVCRTGNIEWVIDRTL